jgi:pilus assembly protein CpaE
LVDLDFVGGACGRYLDLTNEFDIQTVLKTPERIDLEFIGIVERDHQANFSLLSFRRPNLQISDIGSDFVYRLLDVVTYRYAKVVLDIPSYPTPWANEILRNSDHVVLVTERTVPALKASRELHERILQSGRDSDSIHIVLNKDRRRMFSVGIGTREIQNLFNSKRVTVLPDSWPLMSEALNRGVPALTVRKRAKLVKLLGRTLDNISQQKKRK